jgi:hypothetical protein
LGLPRVLEKSTAASQWEAPAERKIVRPALEGSYEALFHQTGISGLSTFVRDRRAMQALNKPLLDRAIGVIYRPETERPSHYFPSRMPGQFDAVIQIDRTIALIPFEPSGVWRRASCPRHIHLRCEDFSSPAGNLRPFRKHRA